MPSEKQLYRAVRLTLGKESGELVRESAAVRVIAGALELVEQHELIVLYDLIALVEDSEVPTPHSANILTKMGIMVRTGIANTHTTAVIKAMNHNNVLRSYIVHWIVNEGDQSTLKEIIRIIKNVVLPEKDKHPLGFMTS